MTVAQKKEFLVLLDPGTNEVIGEMEKLQVHQEGRYHAAISVLLLDSRGRLIVQKRAAAKYHGGGLWANACCGHPMVGESAENAAHRRLREELGISCMLYRLGTLRYRAAIPAREGTLVEYERVALFGGIHDDPFFPSPTEVEVVQKVDWEDLRRMETAPWLDLYTKRPGPALRSQIEESISGNEVYRDYGFTDLLQR